MLHLVVQYELNENGETTHRSHSVSENVLLKDGVQPVLDELQEGRHPGEKRSRESEASIAHDLSYSPKRQRRYGPKCIHDTTRSECPACKGDLSTECDRPANFLHGKPEQSCKEFNGAQLCVHKRARLMRKDFIGPSICVHDRIRNRCKDCKGSQISVHERLKLCCRECKEAFICVHDHILSIFNEAFQ